MKHVGIPILVKFWDHAMDNGEEARLFKCEVFGVLYKETSLAYYVASWVCNREIEHNAEVFVILKDAVLSMQRLDVSKQLKLPPKGRRGARRMLHLNPSPKENPKQATPVKRSNRLRLLKQQA